MTTPVLYDVHTVTPGTTTPGQFFLRAPATTLRAIWNLHEAAIARIEREQSQLGAAPTLLFDNNQGKFPTPTVALIRVANDELTVAAAVSRACTAWLESGTRNVDQMREYLDQLVFEATAEFQENNVAVTSDEEMNVASMDEERR